MKRIGVLTFHRAINNGAVLQAYALVRTINDLGGNARYIDYTAAKIRNDYYIKPLLKRRSIKSVGVYFLFDLNMAASQKKFHEFVDCYIPIEECDLTDEVSIKNKFDALISGGDQIWNLNLTGHDTKYYLDFTKQVNKYSYGTSFGTTRFTDSEKNEIRILLADYKQLNVRERSAKEFIDSIIECQCRIVPDPVFLLTKKEWIEQFSLKEKIEENNYILYFELHDNKLMREWALHLANVNKCKILRITNDFFSIAGMKSVKRSGPIDFLEHILNAHTIVTDSFHAAAFAIIFNKPLYIGLKQGELTHLNTRIESLVNTYNIQKQIISDDITENIIDYECVNKRISIERKVGIDVLKGIIKEINYED